MSNLGCSQTDEQIRTLIASVDTDGNGMIEFDEFVGIMAARMLKRDGDGEIDQAFSLFDDGSGYVQIDTIREMLTEMGSQALPKSEVDQLLGMLPADASGRVALTDFRALPCWEVPLPSNTKSAAVKAQPEAQRGTPARTTEAAPPAAE